MTAPIQKDSLGIYHTHPLRRQPTLRATSMPVEIHRPAVHYICLYVSLAFTPVGRC